MTTFPQVSRKQQSTAQSGALNETKGQQRPRVMGAGQHVRGAGCAGHVHSSESPPAGSDRYCTAWHGHEDLAYAKGHGVLSRLLEELALCVHGDCKPFPGGQPTYAGPVALRTGCEGPAPRDAAGRWGNQWNSPYHPGLNRVIEQPLFTVAQEGHSASWSDSWRQQASLSLGTEAISGVQGHTAMTRLGPACALPIHFSDH